MSERNTLVRSMHDVGLASWFGGSLMGAVGLNGGAAEAKSPTERLRISSIGWARWFPVQLVSMIVHGIGGLALIAENKGRLAVQKEGRVNTQVKTVIELSAVAASIYAGILGRTIAKHAPEGGEGVTEPSATSSKKLASAQRQERVTQWVVPALTGTLIVLGAQQGEQQRPVAGLLNRFTKR